MDYCVQLVTLTKMQFFCRSAFVREGKVVSLAALKTLHWVKLKTFPGHWKLKRINNLQAKMLKERCEVAANERGTGD